MTMTFPDAFKTHVIPRIRRMITHQAARVHEGDATFGEAHDAIMHRAVSVGASYLPPDLFIDLMDYVLATLATDIEQWDAIADVTDQLVVGARHSPHAQGPTADKRGACGPPVRPVGLGMMGLAPFRNSPFSRLAAAFGHSDWADCWGFQTSPLRNSLVRQDRKEEGST